MIGCINSTLSKRLKLRLLNVLLEDGADTWSVNR